QAVPLAEDAAASVAVESAAIVSAVQPQVSPHGSPESVMEEVAPPIIQRSAVAPRPGTIAVDCNFCGARHGLAERFRGLKIRCRHCGELIDTSVSMNAEESQ